jgi:GGDEF domain-containing protein
MIAKVAASQSRGNGRPNVRDNGQQNVRRDSTIDSLVRKPNSTARVQKPPVNADPVRGQDAAAELTSLRGRRPTQPPAAVESGPKMDELASKEALADWLRRRAAARAAQTKQPTVPAASTPAPQVTETPQQVMEPVAAAVIEPVSVTPAVPTEQVSSVIGLPEVQIDAFLWESLVSGKPTAVAPASISTPETQFQLIRGSSSTSAELLVPAGMYDETHLCRLLEINKPFTGLVVSIGVSENDGRPPENEDVMRSAEMHVAGLLSENDFGCRRGIDEFLLICPGQQGAEAQRRLSNISERLWDFQLRGLAAFTILFSWGGVDVQNEPLSEAVASAAERMHQTKRSRKTVSMDSVSNRRQAV